MSNDKKLKRLNFAAPEDAGRDALLSLCLDTPQGPAMPYNTQENAMRAVARIADKRASAINATSAFAPGFAALDKVRFMKAAADSWSRLDVGLYLINEKEAAGAMTYAHDGEVVLTPYGIGKMAGMSAIKDAKGNEGLAGAKLSELALNYVKAGRERGDDLSGEPLETFLSAGRMEIAEHFQGTHREGGKA